MSNIYIYSAIGAFALVFFAGIRIIRPTLNTLPKAAESVWKNPPERLRIKAFDTISKLDTDKF